MTSGTPAVCAMTSGASDEPPMPASTTRVTPLRDELGAQRLDLGDERTRDADRLDPAEALCDASASASGPHSVGSPAVMPDATRSATRPGRVCVDDGLDVSAQVDVEAHRAISSALCSAVGDGVLQFVPRGDELLDALVLEHLGDVGEVDADRGELVEHAVRVRVGAGDRVAGRSRRGRTSPRASSRASC